MGNLRLNGAVSRAYAAALLLCAAASVAAAPLPPSVQSESYILMDAATGAVLAERNADLRLPPASLTKIMTAYLGFRALRDGALSLDRRIRISRRAWAQNVAGSKTFLRAGADVAVRDLLFGIIVQSGNDAAIALAEGAAGDEAAFVAAMNAQAAEFGLQNTRFANVTGLPDDGHYSSARDVALMAWRTVMDYPEYYPIYAEREFTYNNIRQTNRNTLLESFAGADGVKTGYTKEAGYCLAASAARGGRRLIAVVMKTASAAARRRESEKLLSFGFSAFVNRRMFDGAKTRKIRVFQGVEDFVAARPTSDGLISAPRGAKTETAYIPARTPLLAPIAAGDVVGEIVVRVGEKEIREPVVAQNSVSEGDFWKRALDYAKWNYLGHGRRDAFDAW